MANFTIWWLKRVALFWHFGFVNELFSNIDSPVFFTKRTSLAVSPNPNIGQMYYPCLNNKQFSVTKQKSITDMLIKNLFIGKRLVLVGSIIWPNIWDQQKLTSFLKLHTWFLINVSISQALKVKVGHWLTSVAETTMVTSHRLKLAHLVERRKTFLAFERS